MIDERDEALAEIERLERKITRKKQAVDRIEKVFWQSFSVVLMLVLISGLTFLKYPDNFLAWLSPHLLIPIGVYLYHKILSPMRKEIKHNRFYLSGLKHRWYTNEDFLATIGRLERQQADLQIIQGQTREEKDSFTWEWWVMASMIVVLLALFRPALFGYVCFMMMIPLSIYLMHWIIKAQIARNDIQDNHELLKDMKSRIK